jgi:multicomponent Na+:H+ antiporter subunit E
MINDATMSPAAMARSATSRAVGFFVLWIVLSDGAPGDFMPGIAAALVAAAISLRLLPPTGFRMRVLPLAELGVRFLGQSVTAGVDVARCALDPRLPINPGLLRYPVGLPRSAARNTFTMLASLLPGTVPIGPDERDQLLIHCLDLRQPVAKQFAAEEALLLRVIGRTPGNG